jgi:hypothetical protein
MPIRDLQELAEDQSPGKREFAYDYSGAFDTGIPPHNADWDEAGIHWEDFNVAVLSSREVSDIPENDRLVAAEKFSQFILWALVVDPLRFCPECRQGANLNEREVNDVWPNLVQRARWSFEHNEILDDPPTLLDLAFACLIDNSPLVHPVDVARGAEALVDHAVLAVKYDHVSRLHAKAVAEYVAAQLQSTPSEEANSQGQQETQISRENAISQADA